MPIETTPLPSTKLLTTQQFANLLDLDSSTVVITWIQAGKIIGFKPRDGSDNLLVPEWQIQRDKKSLLPGLSLVLEILGSNGPLQNRHCMTALENTTVYECLRATNFKEP